MEQDPARATDGRDLGERLHDSGLVIRRHDRDQSGVVAKRIRQVARIDQACRVHSQEGYVEAFALLQMLHRMQDGVMLGRTANKMPPAFPLAPRQPEHGEIIRLRAAAGEDQFAGLGAQQCSERVARVIDRGARFPPGGVHAGGVAEMFVEIRPHRVARRRAERSGGVVIEVNQSSADFRSASASSRTRGARASVRTAPRPLPAGRVWPGRASVWLRSRRASPAARFQSGTRCRRSCCARR